MYRDLQTLRNKFPILKMKNLQRKQSIFPLFLNRICKSANEEKTSIGKHEKHPRASLFKNAEIKNTACFQLNSTKKAYRLKQFPIFHYFCSKIMHVSVQETCILQNKNTYLNFTKTLESAYCYQVFLPPQKSRCSPCPINRECFI